MALIKCPECGKEISDMSERCIHCGYPLSKSAADAGNIQIQLSQVKHQFGYCAPQDVTIFSGNTVLWKGKTGEIAEFELREPATVTVQYIMTATAFPGKCTGKVDPAKYTKYSVTAIKNIMHAKLSFQAVDVFSAT